MPRHSADAQAQAQKLASAAPPAMPVWGFFNNDYAGYAIDTCNRFRSILGLPVKTAPGDQGQLFPSL